MQFFKKAKGVTLMRGFVFKHARASLRGRRYIVLRRITNIRTAKFDGDDDAKAISSMFAAS